MRTNRAILLPVCSLLTVLAAPAIAPGELCNDCQGKMLIMSVGTCQQCGAQTSSGAKTLCPACSDKLAKCEVCGMKLGAGDGGAAPEEAVKDARDVAHDRPAADSEPSPKRGSTDPEGLPISAELRALQSTYAIDPDRVQAVEDMLAKQAKAKEEGGRRLQRHRPPKPAPVAMELVLTNTGKKPITINVGGDATQLNLNLTGPKVHTAGYTMMRTMEFRTGKDVTIKPGKSHTFEIDDLLYGFRGNASAAYWLKTGTYKVTASYKTPIKGEGLQEKAVTVTSAPVEVEVVERTDTLPDGVANATYVHGLWVYTVSGVMMGKEHMDGGTGELYYKGQKLSFTQDEYYGHVETPWGKMYATPSPAALTPSTVGWSPKIWKGKDSKELDLEKLVLPMHRHHGRMTDDKPEDEDDEGSDAGPATKLTSPASGITYQVVGANKVTAISTNGKMLWSTTHRGGVTSIEMQGDQLILRPSGTAIDAATGMVKSVGAPRPL
jgi:hypothetical protein